MSRSEIAESIAEKLREHVPAEKAIDHPGEVNLTEWDVLITAWSPINNAGFHSQYAQWSQGSGGPGPA